MPGVQSIERAFALLRALALGPAGVTELADRTELPKSTVARLLGALVAEGAIEQTETGADYQLGRALLDLAQSATPDRSLVATARPFLSELTEAIGETSGVSILDGDEVRYLDSVSSEEEVQVRDWTGDTVTFNVVPSGFALVAGLPADEVDRCLHGPLALATDRTLTHDGPIRRRLTEVGRDGYVWCYGEFDDDLNSVAAPVIDGRGATVAALHIQGPAYRFPPDGHTDEINEQLVDSARRLAERLT